MNFDLFFNIRTDDKQIPKKIQYIICEFLSLRFYNEIEIACNLKDWQYWVKSTPKGIPLSPYAHLDILYRYYRKMSLFGRIRRIKIILQLISPKLAEDIKFILNNKLWNIETAYLISQMKIEQYQEIVNPALKPMYGLYNKILSLYSRCTITPQKLEKIIYLIRYAPECIELEKYQPIRYAIKFGNFKLIELMLEITAEEIKTKIINWLEPQYFRKFIRSGQLQLVEFLIKQMSVDVIRKQHCIAFFIALNKSKNVRDEYWKIAIHLFPYVHQDDIFHIDNQSKKIYKKWKPFSIILDFITAKPSIYSAIN